MACCRPSTIAKAHRGSSRYTISSAKTCAPKQSVGARDVRCLAIRAREVLIYKEITSWASRNAFPKWQEGRHPHCHFRGLLRLHSRYGPPDRSAAHRRPLSPGSNPCGYPHQPLLRYRINRQLSGWIPPPLMIRAFGAHCHKETYAVQQTHPRALMNRPFLVWRLAGTFLRNLHWQPDRESRPTAGLALYRDIPTHHLTETLTDREPKACATILAGCCGRNLGELLE